MGLILPHRLLAAKQPAASGFSPSDISDLRGWWDADNYSGSGTTWPDASGNALDLTFSPSTPTWSDHANGHKQFEFRSATNHYANIADGSTGGLLDFALTDNFSVVAIVNQYTALAAGKFVMAKRSNAGTSPGYSMGLNGAGPTNLRVRVSSNVENCQTNGADLATGTMYLHGLVRDITNDQLHSYQDNTQVSTTDTTTATSANSTNFRIGALSNATTVTPDMDIRAVLVYGVCLTDTDIANLCDYYGTV
jgi:hypothetical protein